MRPLNELALFAGAGGGILASNLLGWKTVCAVEIDEYARSVLLARQNDGIVGPFPVWDDIATFDGKPWRGFVDVVSGGFPCQPFSTASRGKKTAKNMWPEMLRVISQCKPAFVFAENVTKEPIDAAACDLEKMDYKTKALALSAADMGADHIRTRYWLFAYADDNSKLQRSIYEEEMAILSELFQSIWQTDPNHCRVADGVAHRVDRLKAIGNGQVPAVAASAWRYLSEGCF